MKIINKKKNNIPILVWMDSNVDRKESAPSSMGSTLSCSRNELLRLG